MIKEHGAVRKRCRGCLRVALLYPSVYSAAVHSLAFQNMYYMLNSLDYVVAERFVASELAGPEPRLRSLETGSTLREFDVVIVPVSYELDYVTYARMLLAEGLEPLAARRKEGPLVVTGGPVPSMNPAVALGFADAVLVGEAEELLPRLTEALHSGAGLEDIACSRGVLAPSCGGPVEKAYIRSLDDAYHSVVQFRVPGSGEPWGEAYMVEASRGCPHMCRFCMEAHFLLPTRHRSRRVLWKLVERGAEANGVRRVAFYALSFFDHPDADWLLQQVIDRGLEASIGSLRADLLTEDRVELLWQAGQRVVTIAPETLSPRLCRAIGKCILMDSVEEVSQWAWKRRMHVKLYFMLGLPGEDERDVEEYAAALRKLSRLAPPARDAVRVSVNPLVPKPWTPMQYHRFIDRRSYEERLRILRRVQSRVLRVDGLSYRYAYAQAVVARGDQKVAETIDVWARLGGRLGQLQRAAKETGLPLNTYAERGAPDAPWLRLVKPGYPVRSLEKAWKRVREEIGRE